MQFIKNIQLQEFKEYLEEELVLPSGARLRFLVLPDKDIVDSWITEFPNNFIKEKISPYDFIGSIDDRSFYVEDLSETDQLFYLQWYYAKPFTNHNCIDRYYGNNKPTHLLKQIKPYTKEEVKELVVGIYSFCKDLNLDIQELEKSIILSIPGLENNVDAVKEIITNIQKQDIEDLLKKNNTKHSSANKIWAAIGIFILFIIFV